MSTEETKEDIEEAVKMAEIKELRKEEEKKENPGEAALKRLVPAHKINSRLVTNDDIERVAAESSILYTICFQNIGIYKGAYAMHHSQIDDKDPLNFFVNQDREIIINPVITRHSNYTVDSVEGCMSYPYNKSLVVPRYHKLEVEYQTVMIDPNDKDKFILSSIIKRSTSGRVSFIFQHEIDHANSQFIYQ